MKINKLYITVGISCSGKSKFCKKHENHMKIVSLDKIKEEYPDENSVQIAFKLIDEHLKNGNVLFDANNCKSEHRLKLRELFNNEIIAILMDVNVNNSLHKLKKHHNKNEKMNLNTDTIKRQYFEYINDIDKLNNDVDKIIEINDF